MASESPRRPQEQPGSTPANGRSSNQHQGRKQQRENAALLRATRSRQKAGKDPVWSICRSPSPAFSDGPLAYLARQVPAVDHEALHAYHQQLIDASGTRYAAAAYRWVDLLWNVARSHEILFHGIVVFARYKKSTCACLKTFLDCKNRILRLISGRIQDPSDSTYHDGRTLVAIALLAYTDMRDGDFDAAETHLRALPLLSPAEAWTPYEWVYIAWIDLRLALLRGQRPTLPYYIPTAFRESSPMLSQHSAPARKLALSNVKHSLTQGHDHAFTDVCFHMFSSLHEIGLAWDQLQQSGEIPFGTLYGLEYSLRIMQNEIRASEDNDRNGHVKELILLCLQLQTWILARYWTPQRQETYLIVLSRALMLLQSLASPSCSQRADSDSNEDLEQPLKNVLDPTCILWMSFTLAGIAIEFGHPSQVLGLELLGRTAKSLQVKNHSDLLRRLQKWPWLEKWHKAKMVLLWPRLHLLLGLPVQRWQKVSGEAASVGGHDAAVAVPLEKPPVSMSFFGGLEFYVDE